jgi:cation diffusion facilitator CzcD-associated flavoprotein CzcO
MKARTDVLILGAGMSGLCMGIALKQRGIEDFLILEKSHGVGGTWLDNTYPGCGCDVPSHLYCYSFEPNPDWSHKWSEQPEILRYFEHCAEKYGLVPHIHFDTEVTEMAWDDAAGRWRVSVSSGEVFEARTVVSGLGQLNRPHLPDIPDRDSFSGVSFHSARWDHSHDLTGRHVAVIGNGASALQFIPRIAPDVKELTVFQRSTKWILPRNDIAYSGWRKWLFRTLPFTERLYRNYIYWMLEMRFFGFFKESRFGRLIEKACLKYLEEQVGDPELRRKLTPDYPVGCQRILISDDYYQALVRENVRVETQPVARIAPGGVVTADGVTHPADTVIFATGFQTTGFLEPVKVTGRGGRDLHAEWRDGAEAYLGVAAAGYPNLFILYGPNTNLGHNSIIYMVEAQVAYVRKLIERLLNKDLKAVEVRADVQARYNEKIQQQIHGTVWEAECGSWYKTESGKVTNNWPSWTFRYRRIMQRPDWGHYEVV